MIEIYLFINPLGKHCLQTEKQVLDLVSNEKNKIQFRCLPFLNLRTVEAVMKHYDLPLDDIDIRNQLFTRFYSASLDYKALQLQGQKKARTFLLYLQEAVNEKREAYTPALVHEIVKKVDADIDMFVSDRKSDLIKKAFDSDQQIAREMGIRMHPSAVVFNYYCNNDYGILVEDCQSSEIIRKLCREDQINCNIYYGEDSKWQSQRIRRPNLHLL